MKRLLSIVLVVLAGLAAGCASLPPPQDRIASVALRDTDSTEIGRGLAPLLAAHPGLSGFHETENPYDAFAARVLLARAAERSIDLQYYIWHDDEVGMLMWEAVWQAADRGVRVRVLLDDANLQALDPLLAALDAHPNIELRLYNPFAYRGSRGIGYLTDFSRLNRRMHNKSFTVDNHVTVIGGRNVANEYFGAATGLGFADIDVVGIGPVVQQVSKEFDLYWNSDSAYPAAPFVGAPSAATAAALQARFSETNASHKAGAYLDAVRGSGFVRELAERRLSLVWAKGEVLYDNPAKTLDHSERSDVLLFPALAARMGRPEKGIDIVSPYFVPGEDGTALLAELARSGVRVRVLTNSLASSDERVVHAGYLKRRQDLLRAGVQLYELKPSAGETSLEVRGRFGAAKVSGLHAKTYAVDEARIFIGSFNFDQRSARLNTEMGVVIDSPVFAQRLAEVFDVGAPEVAYEVRLSPDGSSLQWIERTPAGERKVHDVEPESTAWQRAVIGFLAGLPIEWML